MDRTLQPVGVQEGVLVNAGTPKRPWLSIVEGEKQVTKQGVEHKLISGFGFLIFLF